MGYTIQVKRATSTRWLELNPILEEGEPGVELNTSKMKIGDGTTAWNSLPYSGGGGSELTQATETTLGGIKAAAKTTETQEVKIDSATGKLYVPAPDEATNGIPGGGTAGQILSKIDGTNYNVQWIDLPSGSADAADINIADTGGNFTATDVEGVLEELFTSVSNGKDLIATAITDKGGTASGSDSFSDLASAISAIPSGGGPTYPGDVTDVATPISTSDFSGAYSKNYAFDDSITNYWSANGSIGQAIGIDFGGGRVIKKIRVLCHVSRLQDFVFEGSDNNVDYTPVYSGTRPDTTDWVEYTFNNTIPYRYYRLRCSGPLYAGSNMIVTEFEMFEIT